MVKKSVASTPGKIILSGEHSVVHDQPAILTAINRRLFIEIERGEGRPEIASDENPAFADYALQRIEKFLGKKINNLKIKIKSEIPVKRGLGSSAALAVTMVGGLSYYYGQKWNKYLINKIAYEIEKKQHQNPSGCDNSIACFGGTIVFQKGKIKKLDVVKMPKFVFLDSGRAVETTGKMVMFASKKPSAIFEKMGKITIRLIEVLKKGQLDFLKYLILENEKLLEKLGIVGNKARKIIREVERLGGTAKICGAGGIKNGSGILLCYHKKPEILLDFAKNSKVPNCKLKLDEEGLRNED